MFKVINEIEICEYDDDNGSGKTKKMHITNHNHNNDFIIMVVDGNSYKVNKADLQCAVDNVVHNNPDQ